MEPDSSLLDGASLANEWSLPVLPEGNNFSHPSSSQELADIFGTSDDEEDVDFPFGLNSDLPVPKGFEDISLPGGAPSSLLGTSDSELFLAGFQSSSETRPRPQQTDVVMKTNDKNGKDSTHDKKDTTLTPHPIPKNTPDPIPENTPHLNTKNTPCPTSENIPNPNTQTTEEPSTKKETSKPGETVVRTSARLRARNTATPTATSVAASKNTATPTATSVAASGNTTTPTATSAAASSEPVRDKQPPAQEKHSPEDVKEEPPQEREESAGDKKETPKEKESTPVAESGSEESGSDEEDPNKLYCICRQPHDDRFMICCDVCEDWFHGTCVGITVSQGKRMEREGREYVCPVCLQKQCDSKEESAVSRSARQQQRELARDKVIKKKLAAHGVVDSSVKRRRTLSTEAPQSYGISQLFLPDNAAPSPELPPEDTKPSPSSLLVHKCIVEGCPNKTAPPSIYCSKECIGAHVTSSLRQLASLGVQVSSDPSEFVKGSGGVGVVEKASNKILVGLSAPREEELVPWIMAHPSYHILIPGKGKKSKLKSTKAKAKTEVKSEEMQYPKLMDPDSVRANAKKALYQILWKRQEEAADKTKLPQSEVEAIAHDIEEKLFNLNQDINPKYKNKYRSLIFNLKDMKNQGLFRKVLSKEIGSKALVRMSTEKLASEELAAWRESTLKKDIEMIKQREEEAGALGEVIRKVTHKGEVEIDSSEIGDRVVESVPTTDPPKSTVGTTELSKPHSKPHSKSRTSSSESRTPDSKTGGILSLLQNSTSEHGRHLYDHHCDICTGKIKPPTPPPSSPDSHSQEDMDTTDTTGEEAELPPPVYRHPDTHKLVWSGFVSMVGLTKFLSTAYPVSGFTDVVAPHLPKALHVMGRIAYVQVWDYLDKIKSSTSKEISVIRFSWTDDEKDAYVSMFNYLLRKHRSGVIISSGPDAIKDMYLVPLPGDWEVPQQLLPFTGPGLPVGRGDILLGVVVHSSSSSSGSRKLSLQPPSTSPVTRIRAEVTLKRRHPSFDDKQRHKRKKSKVEVGFGEQTPPVSSDPVQKASPSQDDDSVPYSPSKMYENNDEEQAPKETVKAETPHVSFYGEHQPATEAQPVTAPSLVTQAGPVSSSDTPKLVDVNTTAVAASLKSALDLPSSANIQNLLSTLSSTKLKELASAVSTLEKISDGPIDQSTLAAAGTAKLRAAFSDGPGKPSPPVPVSSAAVQATKPPPPAPPPARVSPQNPPYQPPDSQFKTEWDQRHRRPASEHPNPAQQQQQYPASSQHHHGPPEQPYHGPPDQAYPPHPQPLPPPPPQNTPYHQHHQEQSTWRDPRSNWGGQEQRHDSWNREERFRGRYRGGGGRGGWAESRGRYYHS